VNSEGCIEINKYSCTGCGECVPLCPSHARKVVDDFSLLLDSFKRRERIIAVVAPAIEAIFPDTCLNFYGWLKSKGVAAIFDANFGAELDIKSYMDYIKRNDLKTVISQPSSAIISFIELYHSDLFPELAPTDNPVTHTIKTIKKHFTEYKNYKILVISLSFVKKREFKQGGIGDFNLTINQFTEYFEKENIQISLYPEVDLDGDDAEMELVPGSMAM
jgi:iron only hydrogenase large subunit-like protein